MINKIDIELLKKLIIVIEEYQEKTEKEISKLKHKIEFYESSKTEINKINVEKLNKTIEELNEKIKNIVYEHCKIYSENGDDPIKFYSKILNNEVWKYPDKEIVILNRDRDPVSEYEYDGGYSPFTKEFPEFKFKVKKFGYKTKTKIIIKALLIPLDN